MNLVSLTTLVGNGLALLVLAAGLITACLKLRRFPTPALLVLGATSLLLLIQLFYTLLPLFASQFITTNTYALIYGISSIVTGLLRAIAIGMFVSAAFIGRRPALDPKVVQSSQPTNDGNPYTPVA